MCEGGVPWLSDSKAGGILAKLVLFLVVGKNPLMLLMVLKGLTMLKVSLGMCLL